jgi:hypothetical protein
MEDFAVAGPKPRNRKPIRPANTKGFDVSRLISRNPSGMTYCYGPMLGGTPDS